MNRLNFLMRASAVGLLVACAGVSQAANFDLQLTGVVSQASNASLDSGPTHYDFWALNLSGLDTASAITLSQGDTVHATISLDQSYTVPASIDRTSFTFFLFGANFPGVDTGTDGTIAFFNEGVAGMSGSSGTSTSTALATTANFFPPNNGQMTFDMAISDFTITNLSQSATVDRSMLQIARVSPAVPEPESYALMLAGLGALGLLARRGQRVDRRLAA